MTKPPGSPATASAASASSSLREREPARRQRHDAACTRRRRGPARVDGRGQARGQRLVLEGLRPLAGCRALGRAVIQSVSVTALCVLAGCAWPAGAGRAAVPATQLYVANAGDATVTRLDAASGRVVGRPLPAGPAPGQVSPGPATAGEASSLLALSTTRAGTDALTHVHRAGAGWVTRPLPLGVGAHGARLAGDGGRYGAVAYHVPDGNTEGEGPGRLCRLALVDHLTGAVERRHTVCAGPDFVAGLALADGPAGPVAYLGILDTGPSAGSRIVAVHTQTGAVLATLPLAGDPWHVVLAAAPGRGGRRLYAVEAQPRAWDSHQGAITGRLLALDPVTLAIEREWPQFPLPAALAVAPDGGHAYALTESMVTHLDLVTGAQRRLALLPRGAGGLAVTEARVYATDLAGHEVWAVDRHEGHLVQTIPAGRHPGYLALGNAG